MEERKTQFSSRSTSADTICRLEVDSLSAEVWASELGKFDDASIYQTWAYGEVSWGRKQLSHIVLKRGNEVAGMAQLRIVQLPIIRRGIAYLRSGPIWRRTGQPQDTSVFTQLLEAIKVEYVGRRKLLLRVIPNVFCGDSTESLFRSSFKKLEFASVFDRAPYRTILLDITIPTDQLRKNLDQKWRNQLNRAERNNLVVIEGADERFYGMFKVIYNEMMDRKAFDTTVDIEEFEQIQKRLPPSQKIYTLLALKDEKPVSALLASTIGDTGVYLLGATSNEGMQHKGSYLLQWRMIQKLQELGCRAYDLGGINPERNPGVYHFKSGFSGKDVTQIGQFELSGSWLSSAIVDFAERRQTRLRTVQPESGRAAPLAVSEIARRPAPIPTNGARMELSSPPSSLR